MTKDAIERIKLFVSETRRKTLIASQNAKLNGYLQVSLELENEAQFAALILKDLREE